MKKRILVIVLTLLMFLLFTVGCSKVDDAHDSEVTDAPEESVEIKITYSIKSDADTVNMAKQLGALIEENTIHTVVYGDDREETGSSESAEIYLGDVTRAETENFITRILPCGYGYGANGNKLVLASVANADMRTVYDMFVSAGLSEMNNTSTPFSEITESVHIPETVTLVENGSAKVTVSADGNSYSQAELFVKTVKKLTGADIPLKNGSDGDIVFALLGNYNECGVKMSAGRITLGGFDANKACGVLEDIIGDYVAKGVENTLVIPKEYAYRKSINEKYPCMPYFKDGAQEYEGADSYTVYVSNSSLSELKAYGQKLEEYGYRLEGEREQSGNVFYTYLNDSYLVYAYYTAHDSSVRIVGSPIEYYDNLKSLNKETGNGTVSLTQLDLGYKNLTTGKSEFEGMSYAIQLSDGSFIMIDGGWKFNGSVEADNLYKWLKEKSGGEDIVISAWIMTHLHHDHMGVFADFVTRYNSKVEIKAVIHNYADYDYWAGTSGSDNTSSHKQYYQNYENAVKRIGTDKVVVPHNGQVAVIGDATVEFLYTHEDFYPQKLLEYNNSSLIFRIWVGGHTVMFSGDAQNEATDGCVALYGSYLKSDFVQVSHHGVGRDNGAQAGSVEWYQHVDPKIVMYPAGITSTYLGAQGTPANNWLQLESNCKEVYFGGNGAVTFEFPYTYGTSKVFSTYVG
ncbi:MAG: MBL fold metallo-hydrolase [Clostridia bacterium]|nr:MBL fold metallo-hydrolase [Clostridia bacterium]